MPLGVGRLGSSLKQEANGCQRAVPTAFSTGQYAAREHRPNAALGSRNLLRVDGALSALGRILSRWATPAQRYDSGAVMDYYRELLTDDPFRRSQRDRPGDSADEDDKGDLFGLRERPRHLRVLVDRESLKDPSNPEEAETAKVLEALLTRYTPVDRLFIDMSRVHDPDTDDRTPNVVHLRDYTEQKGWGSYPGPLYRYHIYFTQGRTREVAGNIAPQPQLFQNLFDYTGQAASHLAEIAPEDISRHVLLTQTGSKVADMVVSESLLARRTDIPANYDANVFSRSQAIPIVAHYLRSQQIYVLDPTWGSMAGSRKVFYHSAVYAMAGKINYWEAKADYVMFTQPRYRTDCREMIGRLIRALKAFDDLRFHLGALQTSDSYDDVADCVDRILWSLCGAVDVIARSLHYALQLPGTAMHAKLHGNWYRDQFRPIYSHAAGISNVDRTQAALATVFKLRNAIHYRALRAAGTPDDPAPYVGKDRGRIQLLIPNDVYALIDANERSRWGIEEVDAGSSDPATADLATVSSAAVDAVFSFIDQLCGIISFEGIQGKDEVLKLDVFTVLRDNHEGAAMVRRLMGFRTTESETIGTPYSA